MLNHALVYAGAGLEAFPVKPDKTPFVSQHMATMEADQLRDWWARWPDANIGHRLNAHTVILDVDPRHGGLECWRSLRAELPGFVTRTHYSGRGDGGGHVWFVRPGDQLSTLKLDLWAKERGLGHQVGARWNAGIDLVTRDHRYTILPPSVHAESGKPYRWAQGKGLDLEPVAMPALLAELVARDELPTVDDFDGFRDVSSIADWYSGTHGFGPLLEREGWVCASGDGESDGSRWRHPEATGAVSATIHNGCLFVYSTSTPFEPTTPGDVHGYTPFRAYALLRHGGDLSAAGRAARQERGSDVRPDLTSNPRERGSDPSGTRHSSTGALRLTELERFWAARPVLTHIRDFARSRRCSPWALLGVVLARVAAATPPFVVLPPLVGSHLSLNFYVTLVGGSGAGKDAAISAGADCIDVGSGAPFRQIGLGSGEGILDQYVTYRPPKGDDPGGIEQHNASVLFTNSEIQTLGALKGRAGSTLMPELRNAWSGKPLGFAYANRERRLSVAAHAYRLSLIVGGQPNHCGILLDDAESAAGTPQRFVWLPASDPEAPDDPPIAPEAWGWNLPRWPNATGGRAEIEVCGEITRAVHEARLARLRSNGSADALDGHAVACREKVAALLAVLDQRARVGVEDWILAGLVQEVSDGTRSYALAAMELDRAQLNIARGEAEGHRRAKASEVEVEHTEHAVQRICHLITNKLAEEDGLGRSILRNQLPARDRGRFDEAIARLTDAGQVESFKHGRGNAYRLIAADTRTRGHDSERDRARALRESPGER